MGKIIGKTTKRPAPSARKQKAAFKEAQSRMCRTSFGQLTSNTQQLLLSKDGKALTQSLLSDLARVSVNYPLDVVAASSLAFAGNSYVGFLAFLELNK
jgi:hypothetical protein